MNPDHITVDQNGETLELGHAGTLYINVNTGETAHLMGAGFDKRRTAVMFLLDADDTIHTVPVASNPWNPHPDYFAA